MKGLEALREARLEAARARAGELMRSAGETARLRLDAAGAEARGLVQTAEREGEASADVDTVREWTAARRRARTIVLAAQRAAYDELCRSVLAAAQADPRYPALLDRVAYDARRLLGPGAEVVAGDAGVHGSRRRRHVSWSLAGAVEASVQHAVTDLEALWA